jgi:hypothetical protein
MRQPTRAPPPNRFVHVPGQTAHVSFRSHSHISQAELDNNLRTPLQPPSGGRRPPAGHSSLSRMGRPQTLSDKHSPVAVTINPPTVDRHKNLLQALGTITIDPMTPSLHGGCRHCCYQFLMGRFCASQRDTTLLLLYAYEKPPITSKYASKYQKQPATSDSTSRASSHVIQCTKLIASHSPSTCSGITRDASRQVLLSTSLLLQHARPSSRPHVSLRRTSGVALGAPASALLRFLTPWPWPSSATAPAAACNIVIAVSVLCRSHTSEASQRSHCQRGTAWQFCTLWCWWVLPAGVMLPVQTRSLLHQLAGQL